MYVKFNVKVIKINYSKNIYKLIVTFNKYLDILNITYLIVSD